MALTQVDGGLLSPTNAQYTGFKNRIINGAMSIWQRGTSGTISGYQYVSADRWAAGNFQATTLSQSSSVPNNGFQYSLKVQKPAGSAVNSAILLMQTIESNNCYDLSGQTVTLSFWAKAGANYSASGSYLAYQLGTGTTADQGGNYPYYSWNGISYGLNSTLTLTTTWQKFTFTATLGAGVLEAFVNFYYTPTGTAGADDAFYITGVQLEKGSTATSFDYRPYGTELALCQRYYSRFSGLAGDFIGFVGQVRSPTVAGFNVSQQATFRATPTVSYSNLAINDTGVNATVTSASAANTNYFSLTASGGGLTTARAALAYLPSNGFIDFSAEL